jgi:hypothetical protein
MVDTACLKDLWGYAIYWVGNVPATGPFIMKQHYVGHCLPFIHTMFQQFSLLSSSGDCHYTERSIISFYFIGWGTVGIKRWAFWITGSMPILTTSWNGDSCYFRNVDISNKTGGQGVSQSVWRWAMGWTERVRFPIGSRNVSLLNSVNTGSGANPALSRGVYWPWREDYYSTPSSVEVRRWSYTSYLRT